VQYWIIQTLNSLALGGLLFLLAAGFSLIFGLMRTVNMAHGALLLLGGYIAYDVQQSMTNGGDLYVVGLEGNLLKVHYQGACGSCPSSLSGTLAGIESLVKSVDPDMEIIPV